MPQNPVAPPPFRDLFYDSARFWEYRRIFYNAALVLVVALWVILTWPHFRLMLQWNSLLLMVVLGLIANLCYCAAYAIDVPLLNSSAERAWRKRLMDTLVSGHSLRYRSGQLLDRRRNLLVCSPTLAAYCAFPGLSAHSS